MSKPQEEAEIVKFPGIASISLSITPLNKSEDFDLIEAVVRVYDDNDEQIMRQKARSLFTIAKNLKLFIQNRTNLPINDRRMSVWFAEYLGKIDIKLEEEDAYQLIKKASQALEKISRVTIEHVEASDLVSIETDVLAKLIEKKSDRLLSEDELHDLLEEHQSPVTDKIARSIHYKNSGGVGHKDKLSLKITASEKLLEHNLVSSFKNETETDLTDVIISDVIPYCYKILDVKNEKGGKYKKELLDDGLKLTWKIANVPSGSEVKTFYTFEKRIPRTIMIRKGEEIRIVQDYNSILQEEDDEGKTVNYFISETINLLPVTLDELIIRDLVPYELRLSKKTKIEELDLLDFGQDYGLNIQNILTDVETGKKFLQRYDVQEAPLIWKINLKIPVGDEEIQVTKLLESTSKENTYICSIIASSPKNCTITNEIESGLTADEFLPKELAPTNTKKMSWDVSGKLSISMVLNGNLSRQPNPISVIVDGAEHSAKVNEIGNFRSSQLLSLPFTHVALYRRMQR